MKTLITILVLCFQVASFAQTATLVLLDSVFASAKRTSMYTDNINWDSLHQNVFLKAENAGTINDLKPAFTALINGLGDKHGKIINATDYSTLGYFTDYAHLNHPDKRIRETAIWQVVNDTSQHFEYKLLSNNVGYLKIVGIAPNVDIERESKKIRAAVQALYDAHVTSWIIDLRYNGGGNMHPMVTGIAPLIGDGIVGSLTDISGAKIFDWEIKSSNFIYDGVQAVTLPNEPTFIQKPRVAVLTSRYTVSSGEIVAMCFKGRLNTRFFGEATGSFTTNNNWEVIDNQVILTISTGVFCDRNNSIYTYNIPVDEEIPFEIVKDVAKDACVIAAKNWLLAE